MNTMMRMINLKKAVVAVVVVIMVAAMMPTEASAATKAGSVRGLSAKPSYFSMTLKWKKAKKAKGYVVYQKKGKKYKKIKTVKGKKVTIKKLKSGTAYSFAVRAYRKAGLKRTFGKMAKITAITKAIDKKNAIAQKYTVTWKSAGKLVRTNSVKKGKVLRAPIVENREGYTFQNWEVVPSGSAAYTINRFGKIRILSNTTVTAVWKKNTSTLQEVDYEKVTRKQNVTVDASPDYKTGTFAAYVCKDHKCQKEYDALRAKMIRMAKEDMQAAGCKYDEYDVLEIIRWTMVTARVYGSGTYREGYESLYKQWGSTNCSTCLRLAFLRNHANGNCMTSAYCLWDFVKDLGLEKVCAHSFASNSAHEYVVAKMPDGSIKRYDSSPSVFWSYTGTEKLSGTTTSIWSLDEGGRFASVHRPGYTNTKLITVRQYGVGRYKYQP